MSPRKFINELREAEAIKDEIDGSRNLMLSDVILQNIAEYGIMHCSQSIVKSIIQGTRSGLPAVKKYLDSRVIKTEHPLLHLS